MNSHDLARALLDGPDLPVATHANNHSYFSKEAPPGFEAISVCLLNHYQGEHVIIGNMWRMELNPPNWFITKVLAGRDISPGEQ